MRKIIVAITAVLLVADIAQAAGEPLVVGAERWETVGITALSQNCHPVEEKPYLVECDPPKYVYVPVYSIGFYVNGEYVEVSTARRKGEMRYLTDEEAIAEGIIKAK